MHKDIVSMPFNGLSLFLLLTGIIKLICQKVYQCPLTGFLYFYKNKKNKRRISIMYQCPLTGFLYFYTYPLEAIIYPASRGLNSPKLSNNLKIAYFLTYFWFF